MKRYTVLLCVVLLYITSSCRKEDPMLFDQNNNEHLTSAPSDIFLSFWHGMNNRYIFWDIDPTDWDKVYDDYLPRFQALDSQEEVSTKELQKLYTELSDNLIDHHFSATIKNPRGKGKKEETIRLSPSRNELKKRDYYHELDTNFVFKLNTIVSEYRRNNRITSVVYGTSQIPEKKMVMYSFDIDNGVAYLYLSQFEISSVMKDTTSVQNKNLIKALNNFHTMILHNPNLKGVIIDMRNNTGGNAKDMNFILAPMLGEELQIGATRSKNGLGRYDYEGWSKAVVSPADKHRKIEVPIVGIVNLYSVSMSEITSMGIKSLPNGYLVGERTMGGTGPIYLSTDYNYGGSFKNPMVDVYTSSVMMRNAHGEIREGIGFTPDVEVLDDTQSMARGVDKQLEAALKLIKEKSGNN